MFTSTAVFTFFFLFYATEINADFLPQLLEVIQGGFDVNIGMVTFVVGIMGIATTVVATLTVMQLFKKSRNISQNQ